MYAHRLIAFTQSNGRPRKLQYQLAKERFEISTDHAIASFNQGGALTDALINGIGITQMPAFQAKEALATGKIIPILSGLDMQGQPIQLVYTSKKHLSQRVRSLIDFIIDEIQFD